MSYKDRIKELIRVPAGELLPNPKNWREHPEKQRSALSGVLAEIGWADAVIARETSAGLMLIDGHLRTEVAPDDTIPVLVLDVDEDEADKILATHDPLAAMAETNSAALDSLLSSVHSLDEGVQDMLSELAVQSGLSLDDENSELVEGEIPEVPKTATVKNGEIWMLGSHRIMCGDARSQSDVARLMNKTTAGICFTSPPYLQRRDYTEESDVSDWDALMNGVCDVLPLANDGQLLVNLGMIHEDREWLPYWDQWIDWMRASGWLRFGFYVWDKLNPHPMASGGRLLTSHEFVFHFCKQSRDPELVRPNKTAGTKVTPYVLGKSGSEKNAPIITAPFGVRESVARVQKGGATGHPAAFPVELATYFLQSWSGIVYEPFLGSGSTLIAAEQLGRECYGMEISPQYCDVIIERWQNVTGEKAKRVSNGK